MAETITREQFFKYLKNHNLRVIAVKTPDIHSAINVIQQADRALKIARSRLLQPGYEPERVLPLIKKFRDSLVELNKVSKELAELTKIEYREPKMFREKEEK